MARSLSGGRMNRRVPTAEMFGTPQVLGDIGSGD